MSNLSGIIYEVGDDIMDDVTDNLTGGFTDDVTFDGCAIYEVVDLRALFTEWLLTSINPCKYYTLHIYLFTVIYRAYFP